MSVLRREIIRTEKRRIYSVEHESVSDTRRKGIGLGRSSREGQIWGLKLASRARGGPVSFLISDVDRAALTTLDRKPSRADELRRSHSLEVGRETEMDASARQKCCTGVRGREEMVGGSSDEMAERWPSGRLRSLVGVNRLDLPRVESRPILCRRR